MWSATVRVKCIVLISAIWLGNGSFCQAQDKDAEIKELNKKQNELLDEALEILNRRFAVGADAEDIFREVDQVLMAKLNLAETPKERIMVLEKLLLYANRTAELVEAGVNIGKATRYQLLRAKARGLEVRVQLLKEEQKIMKKQK